MPYNDPTGHGGRQPGLDPSVGDAILATVIPTGQFVMATVTDKETGGTNQSWYRFNNGPWVSRDSLIFYKAT